jgi:hypothetical protein
MIDCCSLSEAGLSSEVEDTGMRFYDSLESMPDCPRLDLVSLPKIGTVRDHNARKLAVLIPNLESYIELATSDL